ncbi:MAG: DUF3143 domain-containing protein [Cyanophyceae cyanobacterium]|jgi:hypothetical protein
MDELIKMPDDDVPLYSHPLVSLENWLVRMGCQRDPEEVERWSFVGKADVWSAEIRLEEAVIWVRYTYPDGNTKTLTFPYSLSRSDAELAIFDT